MGKIKKELQVKKVTPKNELVKGADVCQVETQHPKQYAVTFGINSEVGECEDGVFVEGHVFPVNTMMTHSYATQMDMRELFDNQIGGEYKCLTSDMVSKQSKMDYLGKKYSLLLNTINSSIQFNVNTIYSGLTASFIESTKKELGIELPFDAFFYEGINRYEKSLMPGHCMNNLNSIAYQIITGLIKNDFTCEEYEMLVNSIRLAIIPDIMNDLNTSISANLAKAIYTSAAEQGIDADHMFLKVCDGLNNHLLAMQDMVTNVILTSIDNIIQLAAGNQVMKMHQKMTKFRYSDEYDEF